MRGREHSLTALPAGFGTPSFAEVVASPGRPGDGAQCRGNRIDGRRAPSIAGHEVARPVAAVVVYRAKPIAYRDGYRIETV